MDIKKYAIIKTGLDDKELNSLDELDKKYKKLITPNFVTKTTKKIGNLIPENIKKYSSDLSNSLTEKELFIKMMELVDEGFSKVEETASKYSISESQVINKINKNSNTKVKKLEDICWLKSYDISKTVNAYKLQEIAIAGTEGGITGFAGLPGLPFNLVLSTFLYFRAVQSVAMFYGYDVKNDPEELALAGEVLKEALNPQELGEEEFKLNANLVTKVLIVGKAEKVKQASKKTWTEMASKDGIPLLLTQVRALGHKSAEKALQKAGKSGLEHSIFRDILTQIGKKLPKKAIPKSVAIVGSVFGSLIDGKQMSTIIDYADVYYQKRFILEKESRIKNTSKYKMLVFIKVGIISLIAILIIALILSFVF